MNDLDNMAHEHPDDELERYLNGKHPLSKLYEEADTELPPPALDSAAKRAAHKVAAPRRRRWQRPVAAAAVLVLGLGLLLQLQLQPPPSMQPPTAMKPAPRHAVPSARKESAPAPAPQSDSANTTRQFAPRPLG